jgi:hypothetical protein
MFGEIGTIERVSFDVVGVRTISERHFCNSLFACRYYLVLIVTA